MTHRGGFPELIMKFKVDSNLKIVAAAMAAPKDPEAVAVELCEWFVYEGYIEADPKNFNVAVSRATAGQNVMDICALLALYLYRDTSKPIPAGVFDAFCALVILPEGCPKCGGKLKYVEEEGRELRDGDYYTPNSYIVDYFVYICRECGEIIKSEDVL